MVSGNREIDRAAREAQRAASVAGAIGPGAGICRVRGKHWGAFRVGYRHQ